MVSLPGPVAGSLSGASGRPRRPLRGLVANLVLPTAQSGGGKAVRVTDPSRPGDCQQGKLHGRPSTSEALGLPWDRYQTEWTWSACGPLGPWLTVYSTFWFSVRVR